MPPPRPLMATISDFSRPKSAQYENNINANSWLASKVFTSKANSKPSMHTSNSLSPHSQFSHDLSDTSFFSNVKNLEKKEPKKEKLSFRKIWTHRKKSPSPTSEEHSFSRDNPTFVDISPTQNLILLNPGSNGFHASSDSCQSKILNTFSYSKSSKSKQPTILSGMKTKEKYRCIVPYPPNTEYELELKMGDIVFVHKKREDGWFKGTLQRNGKTGLFPGSFVETF